MALCPLYKSLCNRYFGYIQESDYINLLKCSGSGKAFKIGKYRKVLKLRKDILGTLQNPENSLAQYLPLLVITGPGLIVF